jgi:MFS transporter, FSR family, fosmidomycin resistance protein
LIIGAAAFVLAGVVHSFWFLVAMFALAGVGNTVYHPADYALLSQHISAQRIGQAFSVHTFAGMLGSAAAPPALLLMQEIWGWRTAFVVSGLVGLLVAVVVAVMPEASDSTTKKAGAADDSKPDWYVLLSPPILLNLFFFMLLAMITAGLYNYSAVALNDLYSTPLATGNAGLTAFLLASSGGVLIGGLLVGRTSRHALVATLCLIATAAFVLLVGLVDLGELVLVVALALAGLFSGVMMPSRDMIVRAVTPPGSFGKVFGFVTSGFNLGGIVAPLVFGPIMDHGSPRLVFLAVAALCLISMGTVVGRMRG